MPNRHSSRASSDAWDYQDISLSYLRRRGSDSANDNETRGRSLTEETTLTVSPEKDRRQPESAADVEASVNPGSKMPEVDGGFDETHGAVGGVAPEEMGRRREGEVTVEVQMEPIAPPPVPSRRPKVSSTRSSKRFPRSPGVKLTPLTVSDDAEAIEAVAEVSL